MLDQRMTCRDVSGLLPLFFDGELASRQMRSVALHSSRCADCESELRQFERVQELVASTITAEVDAIDLSRVWPAVEARVRTRPGALAKRWRVWWEELDWSWAVRMPMLGAAAAAAVLAVALWSGPESGPPQLAQLPAVPAVDNSATLDSLDSGAETVAVLSEPETNTMVLWINDDSDYGAEGFPP